MQIRQLKVLRTVITTGTTTQAAEILNITQPAVSSVISNFERELGFALFERTKGRLTPTPEALRLADEAEKTISSFNRISEMARDLRENKAGNLRVACLPSLALDFLPRVLASFLADRPKISSSLQIQSSTKVREWVASQYVDVGIAELPADDPMIEWEPLEMQCVCVLPKAHPLAKKKVVTPADLDGVPFISLNQDHMTFARISNAFEAAGAKLTIRVEAGLFSPACVLVAEGVGVSLVDPVTARAHAGRGIVARPFEPPIPFNIALMYPAYRPRSRLVNEFVSLFKEKLAHDAA
ncbi:LysR family transcriptional regulator [Burkholderia anthina]|uniref:LysR family transcriptional regulator n=1 Tax=Burkholderia anthina TaxID=179879 RepID=UPI00158E8F88|nr:LysR family transcriptional regulator [Burkholderia anthina]